MNALVGLLLVDLALLALAVVGALLARRRRASTLVYGGALALSGLGLAFALGHFLGRAAPATLVLPIGLPWLGAHFRLDALSAFFLALGHLGAAAASLYGLGYGRHENEPSRVLPFYPAFLAGLGLVPLADDAYSFLVAWEFMSLTSWALVSAHHRGAETRNAGFVYLVMAVFGALMLLLAFGLLAGASGGYAFATMRAHPPGAGVAALALALALIGAGSKAGLVPLHVWLPLAHPAAPSHVSALMSAVMTKIAVYAFVRFAFDLLGPPDWRWSVPVLVLGAATAGLGALSANLEVDLKRLLAFSTVENIGLIFVALGLALAFKADDLARASALAMTAAMLHALNHMLFKSLLFFGAGAVLTATGARNLDRLGGLFDRMRWTSLAMLAGSAAIAGLPPLNGFVSEWLMLQAVLLGPAFPQWSLKLLTLAMGAVVALVAALAAAAFARMFGIAFLGRPRSPEAAAAREVDAPMRYAMAGLAGACLLAGVFPGALIDALKPLAEATVGAAMPLQSKIPWTSIAPIAELRSSYNGLLVLVFFVASGSAAAYVIHRVASAAIRRAPAWDCGFPNADPVTQYTAVSFAEPIRRVYGPFAFAARAEVDMPGPGEARPARLSLHMTDRIWRGLYAPLGRAVDAAATWLNPLQFLTIRQYLSVVFGALLALLALLAIRS
ncbi:MAG TPA: hydrogenase 4 subunit B [Roseiarcus sp.]|nr:hydrogenase 4 subunit B [Roseiarcus sp.]